MAKLTQGPQCPNGHYMKDANGTGWYATYDSAKQLATCFTCGFAVDVRQPITDDRLREVAGYIHEGLSPTDNRISYTMGILRKLIEESR